MSNLQKQEIAETHVLVLQKGQNFKVKLTSASLNQLQTRNYYIFKYSKLRVAFTITVEYMLSL